MSIPKAVSFVLIKSQYTTASLNKYLISFFVQHFVLPFFLCVKKKKKPYILIITIQYDKKQQVMVILILCRNDYVTYTAGGHFNT